MHPDIYGQVLEKKGTLGLESMKTVPVFIDDSPAKDQESIEYQGIPQAVYFYLEKIIEGCTDPLALNHNPDANENNGTCNYGN